MNHSSLDGIVAEAGDGAVLRVRVKPRSRRTGVLGVVGAELSVAVAAVPEKGRANGETLRTLADWLGLPASRLSVSAGVASRSKRVRVAGIGAAELRRLIAARIAKKGL